MSFKKTVFYTLYVVGVLIFMEIALRGISQWINDPTIQTLRSIYRGRPVAKYGFDDMGSPIWKGGYKTYLNKGIPPQFTYYDAEGFRPDDRANFNKQGIQIGLFGDSYIENLQVDPHETIAKLTENRIRKALERDDIYVFNFGVGGTGTFHEYLRYLSVRKLVNLDYVVLGFLPQNDVINNHLELGKDFALRGAPYFQGDAKSAVAAEKEVSPKDDKGARMLIGRGIQVLKTYSNIFAWLRHFKILWLRHKLEASAFLYQNYGLLPNSTWEEAWNLTEQIIGRMHRDVTAEGSQFVLLILTDSLQINSEGSLEGRYDYTYPNKRLFALSQKNNFDCVDTYGRFMTEKEKLQPPYFSWQYDGHYARRGNDLTADILSEYIVGQINNQSSPGIP